LLELYCTKANNRLGIGGISECNSFKMRASDISLYENKFHRFGIDALGKKFILKNFEVIVPDMPNLPVTLCRRENKDQSYFVKSISTKTKIVLHFTAGYLGGDIATLTQPGNLVSVPFVIARSGHIYNLWPSNFWSYHLGPGASGGNTLMSKTSIAIEISNIGPLIKKGDKMVTSYSTFDIYCNYSENEYFEKINNYRGFSHFAKFSPEQYLALRSLLKYLTWKYKIPYTILPKEKRYDVFTDSEALEFTGICTHVNFRSDKYDIGPAFDWNKIQ